MQLAVLGGSGLLSGGFMFKAAILGASIAGSMILNGNKKPQGKLNDLRVSSSSYGRGIPKVWGSMRVTGNMFWATDFREEKVYVTQKGKEKTGVKGEKKSKKGKAQPIYRYYANFAMGLCEGPMDQVVRIWADNNLIYNKLNPEDPDLVGPGFSLETEDEDSGKRSQKSMAGKKGSGGESGQFAWTFYPGDEDQKPDPYMESVQGNGKVPAYRGLCYLMFQDFALQDFGNRIPTITAEVINKTRRRAQVLKFENMDPYDKNDWDREIVSAAFDITNGNLVAQAHDEDGSKVFRVWDMESRKEIRRTKLKEVLPQFAIHGQPAVVPLKPTKYEGSGIKAWGRPNDMELFCVTPQGHLCLYQMEGNVSPVAFMDYMNGNIVKGWGRSGAFGNVEWPWDGIFAPGGAFPVLGTDDIKGYARAFTCVTEIFGRIHVFDEYYNKLHDITCGGRRGYHRQGVMGTDHGIYFASANGGSGATHFTIYWATVSSTPYNDQMEHRLGQWPEVAGSKGSVLVMYDMAYIVGANCIGMIIGNAGDAAYAVKMNVETGAIEWEKRLEGVNTGFNLNGFVSPRTYINTNGWTIQNHQHIIRIDFHLERVTVQALQEGVSYPSQETFPRYYWSERDAFIGFSKDADTKEVYPTIVYQDRVVQSKVNIGAICKQVSERVGIPPEQINVQGVTSQEDIVGYMFEQPTDARSVLQELANTFQFDAFESDDTLVFKMRGSDPIITIPEELLGVVESEFGTDNERLIETTQHQLELPERVTVTFYNPKKDYENGSQYYKRPSRPLPVMSTREHYEVTFNMAMLNSQAKSLAKRILYAAWSERTTQQFKLPRDFLTLDPSDVVRIELKDGRALDCRITDITQGANMELEVTSVSNLPDSYQHTDVADPDTGIITQPGNWAYFATPEIMNIPYIDDGDEDRDTNLGFYWAAKATKPGFNYGMLMSRHEDSNWAGMGITQLDAIWGYTRDLIPPPQCGWNTEDTKTVITLVPAFDFNDPNPVISWESETEDEWPSGKNMIIVNGEIILFKDVVENPDGTLTISRLIRGYRGSIAYAYGHTQRTPWVRFTPDSVHHESDALDYLNKVQDFIIHAGNPLAPLVAMRSAKLDGGTERPLPVGDVRRINQPNGDHLIKWSRSTRVGGALKDSTGSVPLNEESERYQVILLDKAASFDPNTFDPDNASSYKWKSAILTQSQLLIPKQTVLDAGYDPGPTHLNLVIYQLSATVHWGFPLHVVLPYAHFGV